MLTRQKYHRRRLPHRIARLDVIIDGLAEKVVAGEADVYQHRAWVRAYCFREFLRAKLRDSEVERLAEVKYNEALSMFWCPECWYPIEWPNDIHGVKDIFGVKHYATGPTNCERCWDRTMAALVSRLDAEDNQPARQPACIQ